jgi:hypothetical protein
MLAVVEGEALLDCMDPIQYAVRLLVPPGSWLLSSASFEPFVGSFQPENFTYVWEHPDPRMDQLNRDVAALVERDTAEGENPLGTFARIRELAESCSEGREPNMGSAIPPPLISRPVRLTEPWFC